MRPKRRIFVVTVDLGGTMIRAGWFTDDMYLTAREEIPTQIEDPQHVVFERIGGGVVIDDTLFTGWRGMAMEPGQMRFRTDEGRIFALEEVASGYALATIASQRLASRRLRSTLKQHRVLNGEIIAHAALTGDKLALEIVTEAGRWLGLGIVNLIHLFNPQAIVLGGSVVKVGDLLLDRVRETVRSELLSDRFDDPNLIRLAASRG